MTISTESPLNLGFPELIPCETESKTNDVIGPAMRAFLRLSSVLCHPVFIGAPLAQCPAGRRQRWRVWPNARIPPADARSMRRERCNRGDCRRRRPRTNLPIHRQQWAYCQPHVPLHWNYQGLWRRGVWQRSEPGSDGDAARGGRSYDRAAQCHSCTARRPSHFFAKPSGR